MILAPRWPSSSESNGWIADDFNHARNIFFQDLLPLLAIEIFAVLRELFVRSRSKVLERHLRPPELSSGESFMLLTSIAAKKDTNEYEWSQSGSSSSPGSEAQSQRIAIEEKPQPKSSTIQESKTKADM